MDMLRYWRIARSDPAWFTQRLREEAGSRAVEARGQARREADAMLRSAGSRTGVSNLVTGDQNAEASYFAILDGNTLNLHAQLPGPVERAELVFSRRGRKLRAPVETGETGDLTATVLLGAELGGLPLGTGRWHITVETATGDQSRDLKLVAGEQLSFDWDGPTVPTPPCQHTGFHFRPKVSPLGLCTLHISPPRASAEVSSFRSTMARVEFDVRPAGVKRLPEELEVQFRTRNGSSTLTAGSTGVDGTYTVRLPLEGMAEHTPAGSAEQVWNVTCKVPGHGRLRVGRHIHDVRDPRRTLRLPQRLVTAGSADSPVLLSVRPYYTGAGDLVIACAHPGAAGEASS